ncbi:MAG: hypothetical protein NC925_05765, partial [Candidatus Omnitrophica bacterium]|nr:hypothetical protein [Candidatus Omnitrophota bacterium]
MKIKMFYFIVILFIIFNFCLPGFSYYSQLVGKMVELHGPFCWDILGVALDEETSPLLVKAVDLGDKERFKDLLNSYNVIRITKNTKAVV